MNRKTAATHNRVRPLQPMAISIAEATEIIGVSRSKIYQLLAENKLRSFTVGRRRLIRSADALDFVRKGA